MSLDFKAVISLLEYVIRMKAGFEKYIYFRHSRGHSMV